MHYRALEIDKIAAPKKAFGNFDKNVAQISVKAIAELNCWLTEIPHARGDIKLPDKDFIIHADASEIGWAATDGDNPTGGKSCSLFGTQSNLPCS